MQQQLLDLRHHLHQHPELSGQEKNSAAYIKSFVQHFEPTEIIENIGGFGLAIIYKFSDEGPVVALRCELDALPIAEVNDIHYRSIKNNVSHKCGHDGHMAIVAGLAAWLQEQSFRQGQVVLLFQPAEETGKGAEQLLKDSKFTSLGIDYLFALHNIPGEKLHDILVMESGFSAEVVSFAIHLTGKESHASEPEKGVNPAIAQAELIQAFDTLQNNKPNNKDFRILTPVYANLGQQAYGISAAKAELHYTIRTWTTSEMTTLKTQINECVSSITNKHLLDFKIDWFEYFPASNNDTHCNDIVRRAATAENLSVKVKELPFRFGEDFGWFSHHYKSAMFGLGAGLHTPSLHDASYDFPDELIETGVTMFSGIVRIALG